MVYEKPKLELVELDESDIIRTSGDLDDLGPGDVSGGSGCKQSKSRSNMNMTDGKAFCEEIGATAIPLHCGLFDAIDLHEFAYEDKVVPEFFNEIKL